MRSHLVVVSVSAFDHDLRINSVTKPRHRQAFVPEFSVEELIGVVLPRLPRFDQRSVDLLCGQPSQNGAGYELRPVVESEALRGAPCTLMSLARTSLSRELRMLPAPSIASASHVYSSITVKHFSCCPLAHISNTKSQAHICPAPVGANGRGRDAATRRRARLRGTCRPAQRHMRCARSALMG